MPLVESPQEAPEDEQIDRADVVLRTVEKLKRLSRFQSTADLATVPALDQMERNFYGVVRERRVLAFCRGSALY